MVKFIFSPDNLDFHCYESGLNVNTSIKDMTPDKINRKILHRLKNNDPNFTYLCLSPGSTFGWHPRDDYEYQPIDSREYEWLGYYLGKNTYVQTLVLNDPDEPEKYIKIFSKGLNKNRSIQKLEIYNTFFSGGSVFNKLRPFFRDNYNFTELHFGSNELGYGDELDGYRILWSVLQECKSSLQHININCVEFGDEMIQQNINKLSGHTQLRSFQFKFNNITRRGCLAITKLPQWRANQLITLDLCQNSIDDEGVEILMYNAFNINSSMRVLNLSGNKSITNKGWSTLSSLLEGDNSYLEELHLSYNNIDDDGVAIFVRALTNNSSLQVLALNDNPLITGKGWSSLSRLLCNTDSINESFISNHSIEDLGQVNDDNFDLPAEIVSSLDVNASSDDKKQVAIDKILLNHPHFDCTPYFDYDFNILPSLIKWTERADEYERSFDAGIQRRKLSVIYQFIKGVPTLCEEARLIRKSSNEKLTSDDFCRMFLACKIDWI